MLHRTKWWFVIGVALLQVGTTGSAALKVTVANPSAFERRSETVELQWHALASRMPGLTPANVAVYVGNGQIPSQIVDTNADGSPDVLLFQVALRARSRLVVTLRTVKQRLAFPSLVDARFEVPREDVAWESDRIAFRIYGPALAAEVNNGIDVWVKRVRTLVVDKWYTATAVQKKDTYHEDHGEGADFFSVGRTLGAGGCAVAKGGTVYQPGVFTTQHILATGPVRAMFTVTYEKGSIDGVAYKEVKTYSIDAGHHLNRIDVVFTGIGGNDSLRFIAGLVKRKNTLVTYDSAACWLSLWGAVNDDPVNEKLGTGIVLSRKDFEGMREDKEQYLLTAKVHDGSPITYFAGAGWTRGGDFRSQEDWTALLAQWSLRFREPVKVVIEPAQ